METSLIFLLCFMLAMIIAPVAFFIVLWAMNRLNPPLTNEQLKELTKKLNNKGVRNGY